MAKLKWDESGGRYYEAGVEAVALYTRTGGRTGIAWNGVTGITETVSGGEASKIYADDIPYLTLVSVEELGLTITAYTCPAAFLACDGMSMLGQGVYAHQQTRQSFSLSYKTRVGSDEDIDGNEYLLHLVFNAVASPSERGYSTLGDSAEPIEYSWPVTTTPVLLDSTHASAAAVIDSRKIIRKKLSLIEDILYGTASSGPKFPTLSELTAITTKVICDSNGEAILDSDGNAILDFKGSEN